MLITGLEGQGEGVVKSLRRFIQERLLNDPEVVSKYKNTKEGVFGPSFSQSIHKHSLKKFLKVVYFLDKARTNGLLSHQVQGSYIYSSFSCSLYLLLFFLPRSLLLVTSLLPPSSVYSIENQM
jgi:hypothetical protein